MKNRCLLVIDIQNDYFEGGKNPLNESYAAALKAQSVITKFREKELPVVYIQHLSVREGSSFFIPGTPGAEIHPLVKPLKSEKVVVKNYPNSFRNTNLLEILQTLNFQSLVICGMMTHMCVNATTRAANDLGFECTVIGDACATKDLKINDIKIEANQVHYAFLAALSYFDSVVTDADAYIEAME